MTANGRLRIVLYAVPLSSAGGRTVGLNFIRSLPEAGRGHHFLALVPADVGYEEACEGAGIEFRAYRRGRGYSAWRLWFDQVGVQQTARCFGADIVFTMGNLGPIWPAIPHVILFHNPYYIYSWEGVEARLSTWERFLLRGQRILFQGSLARASAVIAQTTVARQRIAAQYGVPGHLIHVVPNAVSLDHLRTPGDDSPQARSMRGTGGPQCMRVLTLSRYYPHKNLESILDVADQLRAFGVDDVVFFMTIAAHQHAGARRLLADVRRRGLGDRVINLGPVALKDLPGVYAAADVVFLPTLLESFSGSYLEAMYYQRPIVTTRRDFAEECCGDAALFVDPSRPEEVARCLHRLAADSALRAEVGRAGGARLQAVGVPWEAASRAMVEVLEGVARRHR